jgi:hypothetical protein
MATSVEPIHHNRPDEDESDIIVYNVCNYCFIKVVCHYLFYIVNTIVTG